MLRPRLTPCPTCGQQIATTAPSCPKCGMPDPGREEREVDLEVERLNRLDDPRPAAARKTAAPRAKSGGDPKAAAQVIAVVLAFFVACAVFGSWLTDDDTGSTNTAVSLYESGQGADAAPGSTASADSLTEARLYATAQALPASKLEANRAAYAALAESYPANSEYARKRDEYAARIVERDRPRPLRAAAPRAHAVQGNRSGYITGPKGGCYYITAGGSKEYVDKSLCN